MATIKVSDMRARGKAGYVARILPNGDRSFLPADERSGYGSSHKMLSFEIIEDGNYEVQDANFGSTKTIRYYVCVRDGEILQQAEKLSDMLLSDLELPGLEGTPAQISWGSDIRAKHIEKQMQSGKKIHPRILAETSAQFFINNREKLK